MVIGTLAVDRWAVIFGTARSMQGWHVNDIYHDSIVIFLKRKYHDMFDIFDIFDIFKISTFIVIIYLLF